MRIAFPNEQIFSEISLLLSKSASPSDEGFEAASDLVDRLKCDGSNNKCIGHLLSNPKTLTYKSPNINIRNQIQHNPTVLLPGNREATLVPEMFAEVLSIADDLRISEEEALCLFWEVSNDARRAALEDQLRESFIDKSLSSDGAATLPSIALGTDVKKAAKELYFLERRRLSQLLLRLVQRRLPSQLPWGELIIEATDCLIQNNLVENLVRVIREWTLIIGHIEHHLTRSVSSSTHSYRVFAQEKNKNEQFDRVHVNFALEERQAAVECLFYVAYHTQLTIDEVVAVIDVIRDLTNGFESHSGLPILNPFHDVPSSYENPPQMDQPWAPYQINPGPLKERNFLDWEKELVKKTRQTNMPELLRCISALVVTVMAALDTKQVLIDRYTHRENTFGEVGVWYYSLFLVLSFLVLTFQLPL